MCVCVLVTQPCLTLYKAMGCTVTGSSLHRVLQPRILEWVAIPFSKGLPDPRIKPRSRALQADSLLSEPPGKPVKGITVNKTKCLLSWSSYSTLREKMKTI